MISTRLALAVALASVALLPCPSAGADYAGPLIDAHSHVYSAKAIDAYVAAMKRHGVTKVLLLGVGAVQKDDPAWITAAVKKDPDLVLPALPLGDPLSAAVPARLEEALATGGYRAVGEVHVRQVSRKIDRKVDDPAFGRVLDVIAKHKVPMIVHLELDGASTAALSTALKAHPGAVLVLAHGGGGPPGRVEALLKAHPNLMVDLSGMHFERTPALATETGPLDPEWKALIEKMPARFLIGIDVWSAKLFEPAMLDRLMRWTRRVLGELSPAVAEQVGFRNAATLFRAQ